VAFAAFSADVDDCQIYLNRVPPTVIKDMRNWRSPPVRISFDHKNLSIGFLSPFLATLLRTLILTIIIARIWNFLQKIRKLDCYNPFQKFFLTTFFVTI
jgi:hypothetical protein